MGYGIDIGSTALKVVAVRRTLGGYKVVAAARRRIPPGDPKAAVPKLIHESIGRNGARAGVVGLSGRDINLQLLQQPSMKPLQYRVMMGYELEQRKGQGDDTYVDYCTLREPDQFFPQYLALIGIGKASYVDERIQLAARASVDVRDAVPNSFALFSAYRNAYETEGGTVLLIDVGSDNMDLAFVRGGRLVFARNVSSGARIFDTQVSNMLTVSAEDAEALKVSLGNLGPSATPEDEEREEDLRVPVRTAAGQLASFITSSIHHAKVQLNDKEFAVDKIYLSGGGARLRGLPGYLTGAVKIPVEVLDPFRKLDTSAIEAQGGAEFKVLPTDMAVALGLAQLVAPPANAAILSILPAPLKKRRAFFQGPFWLGVAGAVLGLSLLVLTGLAFARKSSRVAAYESFRERFGKVSQKIERMNALETEQRDLTAKFEYLSSGLANGRGVLDVVTRLKRHLPPKGMAIREIRLVDPAARAGADRPRAVFLVRKKGVVTGEIESQSAQEIRLKGHPEPYPESEIEGGLHEGVITFPSIVKAVLVGGEVEDQNALDTLNALREALTVPADGLRAEIQSQLASGRAGWRKFEMLVTLE